jgi:DNA-binding Lrp family transcriptional regulator
MENKEYFSPGEYQYLYCLHCLSGGKKTMRRLIDLMGVPRSTAYYRVNRLRDRGFLTEKGCALSEKGLAVIDMDRDTLDNLMFWLRDDLGCDKAEARRIAIAFLLRTPISAVRRLAVVRASQTALSRAGRPARGSLAALPPGRHDAAFFVYRGGNADRAETEDGHRTRRSAVFIVGKNASCALELCAAHVRRIAAIAMPHGCRMIPRRLLYARNGDMIECGAFAERRHIRGDAVESRVAADGRLTGRVRVFAENANGERFPAEIVLDFGKIAAAGTDLSQAAAAGKPLSPLRRSD